MFFCDGTYGISHQTDNDQCEWSPCSPAGEQIEESHTDSAGDRTTFLTKNNGADKKRYVSEMDQSAVCSDWKSYINKCSEYVGQGNKKSRDRDKADI